MPAVRVRTAGQAVPATMGSASIRTCSTTGVDDVGRLVYGTPIDARNGDELTFVLDKAWRVLWFQQFERSRNGAEIEEAPGVQPSGAPRSVTIGVRSSRRAVVVALSMWVERADGTVVALIEPSVLVRLAR